jgi:hypothetical protein
VRPSPPQPRSSLKAREMKWRMCVCVSKLLDFAEQRESIPGSNRSPFPCLCDNRVGVGVDC